MIGRIGVLLILGLLAVTSGCDEDEPVVGTTTELSVEFGQGTVLLISEEDTLPLPVDVAESQAQQQLGLMDRPSLDPNAGMIFVYTEVQPAENTFWMYNTLIPLSIAFVGEDGRIGSIRDMEPCTSPFPQYCPYYAAGVPFIAALEVNRGFFEEHGFGVGDQVVFEVEGS